MVFCFVVYICGNGVTIGCTEGIHDVPRQYYIGNIYKITNLLHKKRPKDDPA